ncbi:MAG TPA: PASTA domain-containing protein [Terriglobales bacterium]|nr:PASTA domain-containing protein [Terriglobales bacterium]
MRNLLRYCLMALLLLVVALVSALTTMRLAIQVREVRVPDLRTKTPAEAKRLAEQDGLAAQVESSYYSAIVPEGRVLSQTPIAGTLVRRGWQLGLALSLGPQRVTIPQVVGKSDRAAAISIAERGLQLSSTDNIQLHGAESGQVIAQDPPANATDVSAPKVSLLVAQSPSPQAFVMPSFIGQPLGSITNTLQSAGFVVGKVTFAAAISVPVPGNTTTATPQVVPPVAPVVPAQVPSPASIVVSQEPAPGQKVLAGAAINFVVK